MDGPTGPEQPFNCLIIFNTQCWKKDRYLIAYYLTGLAASDRAIICSYPTNILRHALCIKELKKKWIQRRIKHMATKGNKLWDRRSIENIGRAVSIFLSFFIKHAIQAMSNKASLWKKGRIITLPDGNFRIFKPQNPSIVFYLVHRHWSADFEQS